MFKGTIKKREDGCITVAGMLDDEMINYILCGDELAELNPPITDRKIIMYLRKHPEKR